MYFATIFFHWGENPETRMVVARAGEWGRGGRGGTFVPLGTGFQFGEKKKFWISVAQQYEYG